MFSFNYKQVIFFIVTIFLILQIAVESCQSERVTYSGYSLYRVTPKTKYHIEKLAQLMNEKRDHGIEFWTEPRTLNTTVDIMTSPEEEACLRERLKSIKVPNKKIMHNIEDVIKKTSILPVLSLSQTRRRTVRIFESNSSTPTTKSLRETLHADYYYTRFSRYSMIEEKLKDLAKDRRVKLETIGKSTEGRNLYLIKVSTDPSANRPVIFIDAGHHAREWISHVTLLYILESLINDRMPSRKSRTRIEENEISQEPGLINEKNSDNIREKQRGIVSSIKEKLNEFDFWFMPVVNPDGYEYSHSTDRNWRKTRSKTGYCSGVDPNRNYPNHWGESGVSTFGCSDVYAGKKPLSEPETTALAETLYNNRNLIKMYVSLHAYSQMLLSPYGYDRVYPDNYKDLYAVGIAGTRAIYSVRGTEYKFGPSAILLYPAAGGSDDYAHGNCNIRFSYTLELPDTGSYGFLLPPQEIIPVGEETVTGLTAMIDTMKSIITK